MADLFGPNVGLRHSQLVQIQKVFVTHVTMSLAYPDASVKVRLFGMPIFE